MTYCFWPNAVGTTLEERSAFQPHHPESGRSVFGPEAVGCSGAWPEYQSSTQFEIHSSHLKLICSAKFYLYLVGDQQHARCPNRKADELGQSDPFAKNDYSQQYRHAGE